MPPIYQHPNYINDPFSQHPAYYPTANNNQIYNNGYNNGYNQAPQNQYNQQYTEANLT